MLVKEPEPAGVRDCHWKVMPVTPAVLVAPESVKAAEQAVMELAVAVPALNVTLVQASNGLVLNVALSGDVV
jgi:hypothetical protein